MFFPLELSVDKNEIVVRFLWKKAAQMSFNEQSEHLIEASYPVGNSDAIYLPFISKARFVSAQSKNFITIHHFDEGFLWLRRN